MTNFERCKSEILKIAEAGGELIGVKDGRPVACESLKGCGGCDLAGDKVSCLFDFIEWACKDDGEGLDCGDCKHYDEGDTAKPCKYCKRAYLDKFEPKPKKTRLSEFLKHYPNAETDSNGLPVILPCRIDQTYLEKCNSSGCVLCERTYWSQEVE